MLAMHSQFALLITGENNMNTDQLQGWMATAQPILVAFGLKAIGAVIAFIVGRWLIGFATKRQIAETLGAAGFPLATRHVALYQKAA
jgi:hypothetical protein